MGRVKPKETRGFRHWKLVKFPRGWYWGSIRHGPRKPHPREDGTQELKAPDPAKDQPARSCFGILERVFPMGPEGLRVSPAQCLACEQKTLCLKTAMRGPAGLDFREERLSEEDKAGLLGFWNRWSRKKHLHRMRGKARENTSGSGNGAS